MASRTNNNSSYYINPAHLTFVENSGYGANLIQVSASSSCYISVFIPGVIGYSDADKNYRRWKVTAYNNKFPDNGRFYIYVRLEKDGTSALVIYDKVLRGVHGGEVVETTDEYGNTVKQEGEYDESHAYYYIHIGEAGATDGTGIREISYDTGYLTSDMSQNDKGGLNEMWELDKYSTPWLIRAKHWLTSFTLKGFITLVGGLIFRKGDVEKAITDIKRSTDNDTSVPVSDDNLATSKYVEKVVQDLDDNFLSKIKDDRTPFKINVGDVFTSETYAKLSNTAEMDDAIVNGAVHSKEFVSGFTSGKGWAVRMKEYLNSAGVTEDRSVAEFDDLIVRGTMRVFEFIVSQMLGENDNRTFTGMMEVDHYDSETGKVWLGTQDGKLYNTFRKDDIILVQQYNGTPGEDNNFYVVKQYELIIDEVGVGDLSLGEDRLDWVTFRNFASPMEGATKDIITKGDTFVRIDNLTDPNRKGIMQIMTVGEDTPYMDVVYGKKTDPDNALKSRFGNLQGVYNHLFGWLKDFGAYIANLYAVGEFRIAHTGEDVADKIEMAKGAFRTNFSRAYFEMKDEANYLSNGSFSGDMEGWTLGEADTDFLLVDGKAICANRNMITANTKFAGRSVYNDMNMLRIFNSHVRQDNRDIRKFGTHKEFVPMDGSETEPSYEFVEKKDKAYLTVRFFCDADGEVEIGFDNGETGDYALPFIRLDVNRRTEEYLVEAEGIWDGEGDFIIRTTADIYVEYVLLSDRPLENLKTTTETWMEQDAGRIALLGQKIDKTDSSVTDLGIELDATNEQLSLYVSKTNGLESKYSQLRIDVDGISSTVSSVKGDADEAKELAQAAEDAADLAAEEANDAWWEAYYANRAASDAQDSADAAQGTADNAYSKAVANATTIQQHSQYISLWAGSFDEDGNVLTSSGAIIDSEFTKIYSRVEDVEASIVTFVTYDEMNTAISNIKIDADKITINNGVVFIDKNSATIGGFEIGSDYIISDSTYKMRISNDVDGSGSISWENGSTEYARIGVSYNNGYYSGALSVSNNGGDNTLIIPAMLRVSGSYTEAEMNTSGYYNGSLTFRRYVSGYQKTSSFGIDSSGYIRIGGNWYNKSTSVNVGELWVDDDGYIKLRKS